MKRVFKSTALVAVLVLFATALVYANGSSEKTSATSKSVTANFWAAPNPPQGAFWKEMATEYMKSHPGVTINVTTMPESPSSEAGIQAAIAGGTAPAGSENIFIGFGAQLIKSDAVVPLDTMPGFQSIIAKRHMEHTIAPWKSADGHYYILPMYVNAMLFGWRMDILRSVGVDQPPRTYSQVLALGEKIKAKYGTTKFLWARQALVQDTWWQRWFDFFMLYYAASGGTQLVTGTKITADNTAAVDVLQFLQTMNKRGYLLTQQTKNPFETGLEAMDSIGPWSFPSWKQQFPNLQYQKTYDLTPPPVPDNYPANKAVNTFADAKGLVLYKQAPAAQRKAVWDFLSWVLSNPANDLTWFKKTNLPPARDDLGTNPEFASFFKAQPELVPYAKEIPYAVPPIASSQVTELQRRLGSLAMIPAVKGTETPSAAWNAWTSGIQDLLK